MKFIVVTLILSVSVLGQVFVTPPVIIAQAETNQTYNCGSYGSGSYGQNDCVDGQQSSPSGTPISSLTPTPTTGGQSPETGADLGLWASVGAILAAIGLGILGYNRRQKRPDGGTN